MALAYSKKRSFDTFESNQNNVHHPNKKRQRKNKKKKHQMDDAQYFKVAYKSPPNVDFSAWHCLEFKNILHFVDESQLFELISNELNKWHKSKKKNDEKSEFDIHLFHNRHNSALCGFAYVYFANKSDASFIIQQSKQSKLRIKNKQINVQWKENKNDRDSYSLIFQTDAEQKGSSKVIKLSNLHWKTTLFDLQQMFVSNGHNFEAHFLRILEDKNGFPKNQALALFEDAEIASCVVEKLSNCELFGRRIKFEFSCFVFENCLFHKFDPINLQLRGVSKKLLLSNLKQSVKRNDILRFLQMHALNDQNEDKIDEIVADIYLVHNLKKVCAGKCFLEFDNAQNAQKYFERLNMKQLCHRTVIAEFGHLREREFEGGGDALKGKTNRLFVSNLAWDCAEKDVLRLFGNKVTVTNVHFNVSPNGFPKGSAFVTFESFEMATKAFQKSNGKKLKNRVVKMDFADAVEDDSNDIGNDQNEDNQNVVTRW